MANAGLDAGTTARTKIAWRLLPCLVRHYVANNLETTTFPLRSFGWDPTWA
jgi:hypothetical protein